MLSDADRRQIAVDAERSWWTQRVEAVRDTLGTRTALIIGPGAPALTVREQALRDLLLDAIVTLDTHVAARNR